MQPIILAGGLGKRLQGVTGNVIPKPMVDINGKPFLEYLLLNLSKYNVTKIILSVGHKYEIIKEYFGNSFRNVPIKYSIESSPLGTGGAIKKALGYVKEDNVFIFNGDTYFDVNLNAMLRKHLASNADMTIALKEMIDFDRYGCVEVENDRIAGFEEKKFYAKGFINGGIYLLSKDISVRFPEMERFSFEKDFMEKKLKELNVKPFVSNEYFIDIGIPEDYCKARKELISI